MLARLKRRLLIYETYYGRNLVWVVEHQGRTLAKLRPSGPVDFPWYCYRVEFLTDDEEERQWLLSRPGPWNSSTLTFRCDELGEIAPRASATCSSMVMDADGYWVYMRSLYLPLGFLCPWEWLLLWWRRRNRCNEQKGEQWPPPKCS